MTSGSQSSMFEGVQKFRIDKPIRLIELFAGYGSQSLALKYLGVPFEHWRISEWATRSIQAYKDLHYADGYYDYSATLSNMEIVDYLDGRISADYSTPMTREQIIRKGERWCRQVYNNMQATNNLGSITKTHGDDFRIKDTYLLTYLLTYSFPCQDLSSAGKDKGMAKGGNTRSGLLWEVERLLKEMKELPQVLIMENVPEVIGKKNIKHFAQWVAVLDNLGYKSKWGILNAKDFGIPQNRKRCFMVSVLGDYYYNIPNGVPLQYKLKDFLDENVSENYYLKDTTIESIIKSNYNSRRNNIRPMEGIANTLCARDWKEPQCIQVGVLRGGKWDKIIDMHKRVYSDKGFCPTLCTCGGGNQEVKILEEPLAYDEQNEKLRGGWNSGNTNDDGSSPKHNNRVVEPTYRVRKLTEKECFKLMGVKPTDFKKITTNQSRASLYHLAGDSIVTTVLMGIFGEMFNIDYKQKINKLSKELSENK